MASTRPMLLMPKAKGKELREKTRGRKARLEPREVAFGVHAGKEALPATVWFDVDHQDSVADFEAMELLVIDTGEAFPQEPEV
jgi:hypothetical protein